eukprot:gene44106-43897_t
MSESLRMWLDNLGLTKWEGALVSAGLTTGRHLALMKALDDCPPSITYHARQKLVEAAVATTKAMKIKPPTPDPPPAASPRVLSPGDDHLESMPSRDGFCLGAANPFLKEHVKRGSDTPRRDSPPVVRRGPAATGAVGALTGAVGDLATAAKVGSEKSVLRSSNGPPAGTEKSVLRSVMSGDARHPTDSAHRSPTEPCGDAAKGATERSCSGMRREQSGSGIERVKSTSNGPGTAPPAGSPTLKTLSTESLKRKGSAPTPGK